MEQHDQLHGTLDRFLFKNEENGYAVGVLTTGPQKTTIITGILHNVHPGQTLSLRGSWIMHQKFGRQFHIQQYEIQEPTSRNGLIKYLSSGLIKGIGPTYAQKLVDYFGTDILTIIDQSPEHLNQVPGIGPKRVEQIQQGWVLQKNVASIMVFLQDKGISSAFALKIYKKYGQDSVAIIQQNPYRLAQEIWGIGFKSADALAQKLGIDVYSANRIKAGILHGISQEANNGHLYCLLNELKQNTVQLLELDATQAEPIIKYALHELYNTHTISLITHNNEHYIALASSYATEKGIAAHLKRLQEYPSIHSFDRETLYHQLRTDDTISLNEDQIHGVLSCLNHKVTIITGGPGTGKTTLIKTLLTILQNHKVRFKLAAPTGRATKRMMEGTGRFAETLHRLLEFDVSTMKFNHHERNALPLDFLIVDEASMIDVFLAHSLLKALPHTAHLILLGDIDQLPSVGAGNFLQDIIASETIACIRLTHIFRQAQDSLIITNAHRINQGEFPTSSAPSSRKDFIFIPENEPENMQHHLHECFTKKLAQHGISKQDCTVLVPMNRGIAGTIAINHYLQQLLNPQPNGLQHGPTTFKVGDKAMQIRNNYDKNIFNGDTGIIQDIALEDRTLVVNYHDNLITYEHDELDELVLAYALSIHKSQGSEYAAVIVPIFMQHFMLLQRNLLYTAITRAKKLCIFIGQSKAIGMAIANNKSTVRRTFLKEYLTTDLTCR